MNEPTGNRSYTPNQNQPDAARPDTAQPEATQPDTGRPSATIHPHTARAGTAEGGPTIMDLLGQLGRELPSLVTKELALAKVEISESINATKAGVMSLAGGGVVLLAGLIILLQAAVYALSQVMEAWLAALIVGVVVVAIGYVMVQAGKKKFAPSALKPSRTLHTLQKDKAAIREETVR